MTREKNLAVIEITAITREKTAAAVKIATTTRTAAAIETVVTATRTPKILRERAIIPAGEKTATVAAKISRKSNAASFNSGEKYIWINDNAAIFA